MLSKVLIKRNKLQNSCRNPGELSQQLIEMTKHPVFFIGMDAKIIYANDATCKTMGYSREELVGMGIPQLDTDFSLDQIGAFIDKLIKKIPFSHHANIRRKNGSYFPVEILMNYLNDSEHSVVACMMKDISKRKSIEEKNKEYMIELEEAVKSRTRDIKEANEELNNKLEDLEKFHKIAVGREIKMIELKAEIEELKNKQIPV